MAADGGGGGDETPESFADLLLSEVRAEGLDCPSVQALVGMAQDGDSDTVADALSYLVEAGSPDLAAECLRRIMGAPAPAPKADAAAPAAAPAAPGGKPSPLDYAAAGKILNRLVELGSLSEAQDLVKFLLVARDTDRGRGKMLDCYDVSMLLGSMVPGNAADSAGRLLFALYSSAGADPAAAARGAEAGAAASDAAASQTLVPFILGTLVDHSQAGWATELAKQLMYTTLEEIDAGADEYDYSVVGWCMAQMVWYGRADWAARLCNELERQELEWYSLPELLGAVAGWGDPTYARTIENFMRGPPRGPPPHRG